jgi:hypothetical protein
MGFRRNLQPWEIVAQVRELILEDPSLKPTNVVFMGMGEPLLNWPAVDTALTILNHPDGLAIGARHITVSTVGIVPAMRAGERRQFRLGLSLHSHPADGDDHADRSTASGPRRRPAFTRRIEYVQSPGSEGDATRWPAGATAAMVNLLPLIGGGPGSPPCRHSPSPTGSVARHQEVGAPGPGLDIDAAWRLRQMERSGPRRLKCDADHRGLAAWCGLLPPGRDRRL